MSMFDAIRKWFDGKDEPPLQQIRQEIENLDGQILDDGEGGTFQVEVLPQMSYADFVALCESLREERNGK